MKTKKYVVIDEWVGDAYDFRGVFDNVELFIHECEEFLSSQGIKLESYKLDGNNLILNTSTQKIECYVKYIETNRIY